jgi:hypothetical protein
LHIAGIDPGFSGAAALFGPGGGASNFPKIIDIIDLRTAGEGGGKRLDVLYLQSWLLDHRPDAAYCENVQMMPSIPGADGVRRAMGAATGGKFMRCAGHIEATVVCCGVDLKLTMPSQWKRHFGLTGPNKNNSIALAVDLCPEAAHWLSRKKDHNRAEAVLLAVYGASRMGMIDLAPVDVGGS